MTFYILSYDFKNYNINNHIIKPTNFIIPENTIKIHNITNEIANTKGIDFSTIICDRGFGKALMDCDFIIAHNAYFDVFIIANELYRLGLTKYSNKLLNMINNHKIICSMLLHKKITGKITNLSNLYKYYYNKLPDHTHNASDDVDILSKIIHKMINKNIITNPVTHDNDIINFGKYRGKT